MFSLFKLSFSSRSSRRGATLGARASRQRASRQRASRQRASRQRATRALRAGVLCGAWIAGAGIVGAPGGFWVNSARAQTAQTPAPDYKLGPEDALSISVLDHPELAVARIQVDPGGKVRVPVVGSILVTGKTVAQVAETIRRALSKELQHPDVTVTLLQARAQRVFVSGAVQRPGVVEIGPGWRVSEVITAAGGLGQRPELVAATLSRGQSPAVALDLKTILRDSSNASNLKLQAGDVIRVSELTLPVRVAGQVKAPGSFDVPGGATIGDALALAGGFAAHAATSRVSVTRSDGSVSTVDVTQDAGGRPRNAADSALKLQSGDLIVVPESTDRIAVLGAVQKPGYYDIEVGAPLQLAQALAVAGGVSPKAALTRATLVRANGDAVPLDLFGLTVGGDQSKNLQLAPGDIITVPEATGVTVFGAVKAPGTYTVEEGRAPRVLDVITQAGGLSVAPEDARIRLLHKGAPLTPNAPGAAGGTGGALVSNLGALNAPVSDGDLITVEQLKPMLVTVGGEVEKPGVLEVRQGTSLVDVITRAGGRTPQATLSDVTINHSDQSVEKVDLYDAIVKGAPAPPVELQPGDYVVLAKSTRRIYVYGAVQKPDYYAVPERDPLTVGESLSLAGGPVARAKISQVGVLRKTPNGVQTTVLNLRDNKGKDLALNTLVQPGDAVYVPEGKNQGTSVWSQAAAVFSVLRFF